MRTGRATCLKRRFSPALWAPPAGVLRGQRGSRVGTLRRPRLAGEGRWVGPVGGRRAGRGAGGQIGGVVGRQGGKKASQTAGWQLATAACPPGSLTNMSKVELSEQ